MNEGIDDRLLHAKKLLKKYQSKQNHQQQESSLHSSNGADGSNVDITPPGNFSVNGAFHGGSTSMTGSITSSRPPSVTSERPVLDELFHLRQTLREKESAHIELIAKLQELHNHYAELYNAYNSIAQSAQNSDPSVPLAEYALQISQLQTALAVAIEEKTKLQSELRELQFRLQNIGSEYKRLENSQMDVAVATGELANLREERLRLSETIFNQSQQIETHRKECSELEAKILLIQQDRNETQARLKYIYEEKRNLEEDLDRMKNELNMKEIYIRQLTRFSQNDPAQDQLVIQALTEEKRLAEEEAQARVAELNELRKQFDSSRDHYERCIVDLREQITAIQTDFRASNDAKMRLESVNTYQEEQIRLLKAALNLQKQEKDETEIVKNGALKASDAVSLEQFEAIRNAYAVMEVDFFRCRERLQDLELSLEQRDSNLESIQCELINAQRKIADLEEANRLQATINTDVNALAEQLQNQKATVSRAVEQNVELKRQLAELQDKIVAVTNESAAIEDERLSAIANVTRLQKLIDDLTIASETTTKIDLSTEREIPIAQLSNGTNEILLQKDETVQHNKLQTTIDSKTSCSTEQAKVKTEAHKALSLGKIDELQAQLEASQKREVDLQAANERLEHLLTVLEMENESIGEYVALYRFQRANLKKKLCDRDMSLERLRDERADSTIADITIAEMKLECSVFVGIRRQSGDCKLGRPSRCFLGIGKSRMMKNDNTLQFHLLIQYLNRKPEKYKLSQDTVHSLMRNQLRLGKATILLNTPLLNIYISEADPIKLNNFLRALQQVIEKNSLDERNILQSWETNFSKSEIAAAGMRRLRITRRDAYSRDMTGFPLSLRELYVNGVGLKSVDVRWFMLGQLVLLDLSSNRLGTITDPIEWRKFALIRQLRRLEELNLAENQIQHLPLDFVENWPVSLTCLNLSRNFLRELPEAIYRLTNLRTLILSYNQLQTLPEDLCLLENLRILSLADNQLDDLPGTIFSPRNYNHFQHLDLSNNHGLSRVLPHRLLEYSSVPQLTRIAAAVFLNLNITLEADVLPRDVSAHIARSWLRRCARCRRLFPPNDIAANGFDYVGVTMTQLVYDTYSGPSHLLIQRFFCANCM